MYAIVYSDVSVSVDVKLFFLLCWYLHQIPISAILRAAHMATIGIILDKGIKASVGYSNDEASRHIYASHAPIWDRRWRLILVVGDLDPKARDAIRRALFWQGFGALGNECFVHPSADLTAAFDALVAEGLGEQLDHLMPLLAADSRSGLSANDADLVRRAWDLQELAQAYAGFVSTYLPILAELRRDRAVEVDAEDAFLVRLLLIHDYRRLLLRDPELPDVLLPGDWPGQKAPLLCKDLYRRLLPAAEQHLEATLTLADGSTPALDPAYAERFPQDDPLAAISL